MKKAKLRFINDIIDSNLFDCGEHLAIIFEEKRFTYRGLDDKINLVAGNLLKLSIRKGDKIAILLPNPA